MKITIIESLPEKHQFCAAFDRLIRLCEDRTIDVFWRWKKYFKIGQRERIDIPHDTKVLDDFAVKIINDRNKKQNIVDESGSEKHDLLSLFIKHGGVQKKELKQQEIRDITMNFVIAARGKLICVYVYIYPFFLLIYGFDVRNMSCFIFIIVQIQRGFC